MALTVGAYLWPEHERLVAIVAEDNSPSRLLLEKLGLKSGTAEVYYHEIPGGQYSNLRPQVASLGLLERWDDVKHAFAVVNQLVGDIHALATCNEIGHRRLVEMMTEFGLSDLSGIAEFILSNSRAATLARINALKPGSADGACFLGDEAIEIRRLDVSSGEMLEIPFRVRSTRRVGPEPAQERVPVPGLLANRVAMRRFP